MKNYFPSIALLLTSLIMSLQTTAKTHAVNCEEVKSAIEVQNGVFVRPSQNGIMFKDENIANIGFIVGKEAIAVIDTGGSIDEGQRLLCQIRKASNLPIRYVINTHVHPDHTMGNAAFNHLNTIFIGHKNLTHATGILSQTYLRRYNEATGNNVSAKSIVTSFTEVANEMEIDLGNRTLVLTAVQKAHTNNDLLVFDKKTKTLWMSDLLFHKHIPVIGKSGSVGGWLDVIKKLKNKNITQIIPGHGPLKINWNEATKSQTQYLTLLRDEVRQNISGDADLMTAMERIGLDQESNWQMFSTFHKRNISYIFSELEWE